MEENNSKTDNRRKCFIHIDEKELFVRALDKIENSRYFLNPYLTMESLADELNVHRNALSAAVNHYAGRTFPQWLAEYRIGELERLSFMAENQDRSLEELALHAGFSNRASFYRVFRKVKNGSPLAILRKKEKV